MVFMGVDILCGESVHVTSAPALARPVQHPSLALVGSIVPTAPGSTAMKGFVKNLESLALDNADFRRVIYTAKHSQLVLMSLKKGEAIGPEVHHLDQFFRVEAGSGEAVLDGVTTAIGEGFGIVVPAGTRHDIINTADGVLKLYTVYSPPNHRDGVVHHTRADADADAERFDGKTTET
jgi:mannose-6-phosphate isomerase-like protein (cupin superfamily)